MVNFITKKQAGTGLSVIDAIGVSASKSIVVDGIATNLLNRFTGGNRLINAVGKVIGAGAVGTVARGRVGGIVATSMVVSAGDDLFQPLVQALTGGTAGNNAEVSRRPAGDDSFGQANVGAIKMRFI